MKTERTIYKDQKGIFVRVNVMLTQDQLDMLNEASHYFGITRSRAVREGVGDFLDRYHRRLKEVTPK